VTAPSPSGAPAETRTAAPVLPGTRGLPGARRVPPCDDGRPSTLLGTALSTSKGRSSDRSHAPCRNGTSRFRPESSHRKRAKPAASIPHRRNSRDSRLRQGFGVARRSATREGGLSNETWQPPAVARPVCLDAKRLEVDDDPGEGAVGRTPRLIRRRRLGHASVYGGSRTTCRTCRCRGGGWSLSENNGSICVVLQALLAGQNTHNATMISSQGLTSGLGLVAVYADRR
jgi:hypothetical protein